MPTPSELPLVILGPTASGKSELAMAYAAARNRLTSPIEIVAIDAMQVYRRMNVGTAKPSVADQQLVPHHAIDLVDPCEQFAVSEFAPIARGAVEQIAARGRRAVLVAGTGLYLRAVTDPMQIPGRWPAIRVELEARVMTHGSGALHDELRQLDPLAANRIEPSNERRVVRALEVTLGSGVPFSAAGAGVAHFPPVDFVQIGLRWSRSTLTTRIEHRVAQMLRSGLLDEVAALLKETAPLSRTARQALGYKELIDHIEGRTTLDEAQALIALHTRQFAVRQERWFRRDPRIRWLEIEHDVVAEALPVLLDS